MQVEMCGCGKIAMNILTCDGEQPDIFFHKAKNIKLGTAEGCSSNTCMKVNLPADWKFVPTLYYQTECSIATIISK